MSGKTEALMTLGEPGETVDWTEYQRFDFTEADVPALVALAVDEQLHQADPDSDESWTPLHAWRALGWLASPKAVAPLLEHYDFLVENDWALMELPDVMGRIGEAVVEPSLAYMRDTSHPEYARCMAAEGVKTVAVLHEPLQGELVGRFVDYLAAPDPDAPVFNAAVVSMLIDLKASEHIDVIRELYQKKQAELTYLGDIEDVEMLFGLREERDTPPPKLYEYPEPEKPDGENFYALIEFYLSLYGDDESVLDASELDGFLAAVCCAPDLIKPSRWMPAIWGGEPPEWHSAEDAIAFSGALGMAYNETLYALSGGNYTAMFLESEFEGQTGRVVDEWCEGFLRGYRLWRPLQGMDLMAMDEQMQPIRLFATEEGDKHRDTLDEKAVVEWQGKIEPAVRRIHEMFAEDRQKIAQPIHRSAPKVGRNDPCPCGSGKKYKKCCLQ